MQGRLMTANPSLAVDAQAAPLAPDGDAELNPERGFAVPPCLSCGGPLKPNVVFFGENVPPDVTAQAWALYEEAEVLLVVGSSLTVFSGYRFVHRAAKQGRDVAIINLGPTRGDARARLCWDIHAGEALPMVLEHLS